MADYVLTGKMWATRDRIKRAIEATGNRVIPKPVNSSTVVVVGGDIATTKGVVNKQTSKLTLAQSLGSNVVHEDVARAQLERHPKARAVLGLPATVKKKATHPDDIAKRSAAALKAQATRTANRAKEQQATRQQATKAARMAMAKVVAAIESPDDVFGDL